jgi:hypothetical protein
MLLRKMAGRVLRSEGGLRRVAGGPGIALGGTGEQLMVPIRVISFLLLAACGAPCQQAQDKAAWSSRPDAPSGNAPLPDAPLPNAPSVQSSTQTLRRFANEARPLLIFGAVGARADVTRESGLANAPHTAQHGLAQPGFAQPGFAQPGFAQPGFDLLYPAQPSQRESGDFFGKYLYPTLLKRNLNYHPSSSSSFTGRATYAATSIFVMRDDSGKGRLNTSYLLGVLSSAAIHSAYRPSWRRSVSQPFNDFGSRIGNDAGMNLFHEFEPGLQQLMKSHTPKFVYKIDERLGGR